MYLSGGENISIKEKRLNLLNALTNWVTFVTFSSAWISRGKIFNTKIASTINMIEMCQNCSTAEIIKHKQEVNVITIL